MTQILSDEASTLYRLGYSNLRCGKNNTTIPLHKLGKVCLPPTLHACRLEPLPPWQDSQA